MHAQPGDDVSVIALRHWMVSTGTAHPPRPDEHRELQKRIVSEALRADLAQLPVSQKEIVVFIYDDSSSVQEHDATAAALRSVAHISDVIIVSKPSQLASPALPRPPRRKPAGRP